MWHYPSVLAALFALSAALSMLELNVLAMALFPIPVALACARGRTVQGVGLIACSGFSALAVMGTAPPALYYALIAGVGLPLGLGLRRHWTYGWTVAAVAGSAYAILLGNILSTWSLWRQQAQLLYEQWISALQSEMAQETGGGNAVSALQQMRWLKEHWAEVGPGMFLWPVLIAACVALIVLSRWLSRRREEPGVRGSFRAMRVSEWLVWLAILTAAAVFAERQWPNPVLRTVTWNAGVGLAGLYWLNGLSVLVYALAAWRPSVFAYLAVAILLLSFGLHPVLCVVGLFDTWGDFRRQVDKLVAARKRRQEEQDHQK